MRWGSRIRRPDGVVDDELGGLERVDLLGVAAEGAHGVAHGGQIDDGGDAGEVLHEDAGRHVGDLAGGFGPGVPVGEEADVVRGDRAAVFVAQQILQQDAQRVGQAREINCGIGFGEGLQAEEADGGGAEGEGCGGAEAVGVLKGSRHRFLHFSKGSADSKGSNVRELRAASTTIGDGCANRRDVESVSDMGCGGAGWLAAAQQRDASWSTSGRGRGGRDGSASSWVHGPWD